MNKNLFVKRFVLLFFCLWLPFSVVSAENENAAEEAVQKSVDAEQPDYDIQIVLSHATDEELEEAAKLIHNEQRARRKTKIIFDAEEIRIAKGKQQKVTVTVENLDESVTAGKISLQIADTAIAKVSGETVTAVEGGSAVLQASCELSDGTKLDAELPVVVYVPVSSLKAEKSVEISIGETETVPVEVSPENATDRSLSYMSDNEDVASVDSETGEVTAKGLGTCKITAAAKDGSGKSVVFSVHVPSIEFSETEYQVTEKTGLTVTGSYFGDNTDNLKVTFSSNSAACDWNCGKDGVITLKIYPKAAGNFSVTLTDKADSASKLTLKFNIEHSAVYDKRSYPQLKYDDAFRYPDRYSGKNVSFTGKVLQITDGGLFSNDKVMRIATRGSYKNVVYVEIAEDMITESILENDKVTVYGTYDGTETYTALFGNSITIPKVQAEHISRTKK